MATKSEYSFLIAFSKQLSKALDSEDDYVEESLETLTDGLRDLLGLAADDTEDGLENESIEPHDAPHGPDESGRLGLSDARRGTRLARGVVMARQTSELPGTATRGRKGRQ